MSRIETARRAKGLTQTQAAQAIEVSRPTYMKIERGEKELTFRQAKNLAVAFGVDMDELLYEADGTREFVDVISVIEKHKQMIACMIKYGADNDGWITKVKLAKLVYLADFAYYYENGKSISGLTYVKYPRGPVAEAFFLAVDELEDGGTITREFSGEATRFSLVEKNVRRSKLSERELDTIRVVARAWRNRSTEETAEFTYSQLPYRMSGDGCKIVYDLISKERPEMVYGGIKSEHVMNVG